MNQDESVALWRRGKEAWNAWAEDMRDRRPRIRRRAAGTAINPILDGATKPANGWRSHNGTAPKINRAAIGRLRSEGKNVTQIARALSISRESVYRIEKEMKAA
jgi:DNA invertase Pin-like site-specific DNA recombinase